MFELLPCHVRQFFVPKIWGNLCYPKFEESDIQTHESEIFEFISILQLLQYFGEMAHFIDSPYIFGPI